MNLYKIEYNFNEDKYKADLASNTVATGYENLTEVMSSLFTHVLADNFYEAVNKSSRVFVNNPYLSIASIRPTDLDIKILL